MNYVIKIYNQTGFNSCNVPESAIWAINNLTPYREYDTFELVQGRYLSRLRVQLTASEANKIDFVIAYSNLYYDSTCYVVDGYNMVAPDVCEFILLLEPYSTLGGFGADSGNQILGGTAKRCHVSLTDDANNFYTLDEPFINRENIEWGVERISPTSTYRRLIETLSIPSRVLIVDSLVEFAEAYAEANVAHFTTIDALSRACSIIGRAINFDKENPSAYTITQMETPQARNLISTIYKTEEGTEITLGTRWWLADSINYDLKIKYIDKNGEVQETSAKGSLISDLVSDGRSSDISCYWEIPNIFMGASMFYDYKPTEDGEIAGGCSYLTTKNISKSINISKWSAATYNNKLNYGQNLLIKIYNPAGNGTVEHKIYEVIPSGTTPQFITSIPCTLKADLRPSGSPLFMFNYINKADNISNMIEVLQGGNWRQLSLTETGTLSKADLLQAKQRNELNDYDQETRAVNLLVDSITKLLSIPLYTGAGATASGVSDLIMGGYNEGRSMWRANKVNQNQNELLNLKGATASVNITKASCNFATDIDKNAFYAIVSHFSNNDLVAFDTFLTQYGYNVGSMPLSQELFYNRPAYNFIQINDMQVESVTGNANLVDDTIERLKGGLRIWHKKPNVNDMLASGNR